MISAILFATAAFVFFLAIHVLIFHFRPPKRRFRTLIYIVIASLVLYSILFFLSAGSGFSSRLNGFIDGKWAELGGGLFFYFFFYYAYFHQVIIFDRSVTPRIMMEIDQSTCRRITVDELKKKYSLEEKFKKELDDMDHMGRMRVAGEYYYNTPKGKAHADMMMWLRNYLHIGGHQ